MYAYKDADGTIWAPARAEGPGDTIGDGMLPLRPGDDGYDEYDRFLTEDAALLAQEAEEDAAEEAEWERKQKRVKIDIRDEYPQKWRDDAEAAGAEMP